MKQDQLQGTGFMQDGVSYQRVDEQELTRVQQELKNQLNKNKNKTHEYYKYSWVLFSLLLTFLFHRF